MSRSVTVSMLGRGPLAAPSASAPEQRPGYRKAVYQFSDGETFETPLFAHALWHFLHKSGHAPDAVILVGTAGSTWDALWDAVPDDAIDDETVDFTDRLHERVQAGEVTETDVAPELPLFSKLPFAEAYRPCVVDACETLEAQQAFCDRLMRELEPGDRIVLDLTHGYRHLAMLAAFLLTSLKWLMDVEIEAVYYGGLELASSHGGVAPVINLAHAPELARRAAHMATYRTTGRYREMANVFPPMADEIIKADYFESINQHQRARSATDKLRQAMNNYNHPDAWCSAAGAALKAEWKWLDGKDLPSRMLECVKRSFAQRQYFHTITMLYEVFMRHAAKLEFGKPYDDLNENEVEDARDLLSDCLESKEYKQYDTVRRLRNVLVHHRSPGKLQKVLEDEEELRRLLEAAIHAADRFLTMT